mmetsp:Transcript_11200/g.16764  ORF Transcript_11200/g.16764 Transcript_11200/m.16764 type:complete len:206 (-) Transcript_11200:73-690(-)
MTFQRRIKPNLNQRNQRRKRAKVKAEVVEAEAVVLLEAGEVDEAEEDKVTNASAVGKIRTTMQRGEKVSKMAIRMGTTSRTRPEVVIEEDQEVEVEEAEAEEPIGKLDQRVEELEIEVVEEEDGEEEEEGVEDADAIEDRFFSLTGADEVYTITRQMTFSFIIFIDDIRLPPHSNNIKLQNFNDFHQWHREPTCGRNLLVTCYVY